MLSVSPIISALVFLISTLFGVYITLVMFRFLIYWLRMDYFRNDPILQMLNSVTNPPLQLLYRLGIPAWRNIDFATLLLMLLLKLIEISLTSLLLRGKLLSLLGSILLAVAALFSLLVNIFFYAIIIQVIISWIIIAFGQPIRHNALIVFLDYLTEPLLKPARRLVPPVSGVDFSPIVVLIILQLLIILLVEPLQKVALSL